ncbi:MAG: P1 family peptidase [Hyphomicrobiaceae bacterium]|nr:P1 family peptidase [Hyphomicrobiaceae bacterium]
MTRRRQNLITDVPGLRVGNAHDETLMSGVTVLIGEQALVAAADPRGGGLGTRETDALSPAGTVGAAHAITLSGGSAFGLGAATGVQSWLAEQGIGYAVRTARVPIVPGAILFDLLNGGNKVWGETPPYEALARRAAASAATTFATGSVGAGFGATTALLRGGLGSASETLEDGTVVGALAAVNPAGSVTIGESGHFWAAAFEHGTEFGGLGLPARPGADALRPRLKGAAGESTVLAIVATSAALTRGQALRLAIMAQTGLARAVYPVHTPLDGDIVYAVATGVDAPPDPVAGLARLGTAAANTLARAVARGVYDAAPVPRGWVGPPAWRETFSAAQGIDSIGGGAKP